jgi:hypothetical protein
MKMRSIAATFLRLLAYIVPLWVHWELGLIIVGLRFRRRTKELSAALIWRNPRQRIQVRFSGGPSGVG